MKNNFMQQPTQPRSVRRRNTLRLLVSAIAIVASAQSLAFTKNNQTCDITPGQPLLNSGGQKHGPYNYKLQKDQQKFHIVIENHFNSNVERLISGMTTSIEGDLDFTLLALPNYPRALNAMSRRYLSLLNNKKIQSFSAFAREKNYYTPDCYFSRAIYYTPDDGNIYHLFGIHLHRLDRHEEAEARYIEALALMPANIEVKYNLALLYVDIEKFERATELAKEVYAENFPLNGLKAKLKRQGIDI